MTAPLVLVPLGRGEFIALEPDQLVAARARAQEILGPGWGADRGAGSTTQSPENLLTAEAMEGLTSVPATWFLEAARQGLIPHHTFGKYKRFELTEVRASTRFWSRAAQRAAGKAS
ncbi:MAG: hypothetical protein ACR2M4_07065 [Actinomycetota bacterium]